MGHKLSCMAEHQDMKAVGGAKLGQGGDIDEAVLALAENAMSANQPVQKLQLSFECENLFNMDTFSKSDPILFLYIKQGNQWQKIGQTEVIHDNLNPQWVTKIAVQYNFERNDQFRVEVYDIDNESQINNTAAQDALGSLEFTLHEVVTCLDQMMKKMLVFPQKPGHKAFVKITAEEMVNNANSEICVFTPEASFVGESSNLYFFIVYKNRGPNQYVPVYKSEVKKYGPNQCVQWNQVAIGCTDLCGDNVEAEIKVEFYRNEKSGSHKNLGYCSTTLGVIKSAPEQRIAITGKSKGMLVMKQIQFDKKHSFLEYVFGGCAVDLNIAIDFTLSNGNPASPESLHYFDMARNQYLQVIQQVGGILQFYNTDKRINLFGFGGAVPPYVQRAAHCFALNGNIFDPRVNNLEEVVAYYKNSLSNVNLYGPTHFGSIIETVNNICEADPGNYNDQKFQVLLIITDGIINDLRQTIDQIVRGSNNPLAIIIVGVGNADFSMMDKLDGDEEALFSETYRKYAAADIVQFVPFNEFKNNPTLLAKETLNELPGQLISYMRKRGIPPLPRSEAQRQQIKHQMSMRQAVGPGMLPKFFGLAKEQFLQQAQQMGLDMFQVQDFIETRGLCENNMNIVLDNLNNPQYRCPLKVQLAPVMMPGLPMMQQANGQPFLVGPYAQQVIIQPQQFQASNPMMQQMQQQVQGQFMQQASAQGYQYYDPNQRQ